MIEADIKAVLAEKIRDAFPKFIVFRHEDRYNGGIPDLEIIGNRIVSWWEAKLAKPTIKHKNKLQQRTMVRLSRQVHTRYIVWSERNEVRQTFIVVPSQIHLWMTTDNFSDKGFDHHFVIEAIRRVHHDQDRP